MLLNLVSYSCFLYTILSPLIPFAILHIVNIWNVVKFHYLWMFLWLKDLLLTPVQKRPRYFFYLICLLVSWLLLVCWNHYTLLLLKIIVVFIRVIWIYCFSDIFASFLKFKHWYLWMKGTLVDFCLNYDFLREYQKSLYFWKNISDLFVDKLQMALL